MKKTLAFTSVDGSKIARNYLDKAFSGCQTNSQKVPLDKITRFQHEQLKRFVDGLPSSWAASTYFVTENNDQPDYYGKKDDHSAVALHLDPSTGKLLGSASRNCSKYVLFSEEEVITKLTDSRFQAIKPRVRELDRDSYRRIAVWFYQNYIQVDDDAKETFIKTLPTTDLAIDGVRIENTTLKRIVQDMIWFTQTQDAVGYRDFEHYSIIAVADGIGQCGPNSAYLSSALVQGILTACNDHHKIDSEEAFKALIDAGLFLTKDLVATHPKRMQTKFGDCSFTNRSLRNGTASTFSVTVIDRSSAELEGDAALRRIWTFTIGDGAVACDGEILTTPTIRSSQPPGEGVIRSWQDYPYCITLDPGLSRFKPGQYDRFAPSMFHNQIIQGDIIQEHRFDKWPNFVLSGTDGFFDNSLDPDVDVTEDSSCLCRSSLALAHTFQVIIDPNTAYSQDLHKYKNHYSPDSYINKHKFHARLPLEPDFIDIAHKETLSKVIAYKNLFKDYYRALQNLYKAMLTTETPIDQFYDELIVALYTALETLSTHPDYIYPPVPFVAQDIRIERVKLLMSYLKKAFFRPERP